MATKMATKTEVASMSVSYEQFTPSSRRDIPALSSPKIQSTQIQDTTGACHASRVIPSN
jgi:hypothetical protein